MGFLFLSALILVVFSEKLFWYTQGFKILELTLFYCLPAFLLFWLLDTYSAKRFYRLAMVGAFFAYAVEGILTPVLYEGGLFGMAMPAYFVGWHGLLSVFWGWYVVRKWLREKRWAPLLIASSFVGVFWGLWSLTYWLPEKISDPELIGLGHRVGVWPIGRYVGFTFWVTTLLALAHWLMGYVWPNDFKPGRVEKWAVVVITGFFYFASIVPTTPIALIKLPLLMGVIILALRASHHKHTTESTFRDLTGTFPIYRILPLFAMPACASLVYGIGDVVQPSEQLIRDVFLRSIFALQTLLGGLVFLWGVTKSLWIAWQERREHNSEIEASPR